MLNRHKTPPLNWDKRRLPNERGLMEKRRLSFWQSHQCFSHSFWNDDNWRLDHSQQSGRWRSWHRPSAEEKLLDLVVFLLYRLHDCGEHVHPKFVRRSCYWKLQLNERQAKWVYSNDWWSVIMDWNAKIHDLKETHHKAECSEGQMSKMDLFIRQYKSLWNLHHNMYFTQHNHDGDAVLLNESSVWMNSGDRKLCVLVHIHCWGNSEDHSPASSLFHE